MLSNFNPKYLSALKLSLHLGAKSGQIYDLMGSQIHITITKVKNNKKKIVVRNTQKHFPLAFLF